MFCRKKMILKKYIKYNQLREPFSFPGAKPCVNAPETCLCLYSTESLPQAEERSERAIWLVFCITACKTSAQCRQNIYQIKSKTGFGAVYGKIRVIFFSILYLIFFFCSRYFGFQRSQTTALFFFKQHNKKVNSYHFVLSS